jgi:hypothetical protein
MNEQQIRDYLKNYPVTVCAADELPTRIEQRPHTFIVNTDTSEKRGSHWTVFHFPEKGASEFFDSMGNDPERYHERFKNILIVNGSDYELCVDRLQEDGSQVCGHYCIYFVVRRYSGERMETLLMPFSTVDWHSNDVIAYTFVQNL